jgi:hypothetical protein
MLWTVRKCLIVSWKAYWPTFTSLVCIILNNRQSLSMFSIVLAIINVIVMFRLSVSLFYKLHCIPMFISRASRVKLKKSWSFRESNTILFRFGLLTEETTSQAYSWLFILYWPLESWSTFGMRLTWNLCLMWWKALKCFRIRYPKMLGSRLPKWFSNCELCVH